MDSGTQENKVYFQNCVTFNGKVTTTPVLVGENYVAINIVGELGEEFPLVILESTLEVANNNIKINQNISGFGFLQKIDNDWVVMCKQISIGGINE